MCRNSQAKAKGILCSATEKHVNKYLSPKTTFALDKTKNPFTLVCDNYLCVAEQEIKQPCEYQKQREKIQNNSFKPATGVLLHMNTYTESDLKCLFYNFM